MIKYTLLVCILLFEKNLLSDTINKPIHYSVEGGIGISAIGLSLGANANYIRKNTVYSVSFHGTDRFKFGANPFSYSHYSVTKYSILIGKINDNNGFSISLGLGYSYKDNYTEIYDNSIYIPVEIKINKIFSPLGIGFTFFGDTGNSPNIGVLLKLGIFD